MLEGRRLNHQEPSAAETVVPSMRSTEVEVPATASSTAVPDSPPSAAWGAKRARTAATAASLSSTCELISPEAT